MKNQCVFVSVMLICLSISSCYAQKENYVFIPSAHLTITYNKTTNLIFPYAVQNIDRGSRDVLVQQPKGAENIVQVKAGKPDFTETNLSVITADGSLYSFIVDYAISPAQLNVVVQKNTLPIDSFNKRSVQLASNNNTVLFEAIVDTILSKKAKHGKHDENNQVELQLNGIYINHDVLYFRMRLKNHSNISYDADNIQFIIKDRQQSKRTAIQEMPLTPVYHRGFTTTVKADSTQSCVVAFPKFTLPDSKYLSIQLPEKNGGRNLNLFVKNRQLVNAIVLSKP